jgi:predicted DNA-binding protein (MmcQ/YjbR family)
MMSVTRKEFNAFCRSLPATTHVVQWGGADVWKVGGKVFAIGGWNDGGTTGITFKVSDIAFEILKDQPGLRPAPYLASRGMKWIQHHAKPGLSDKDLRSYLEESHRLVSLGLPKKKQRELKLNPSEVRRPAMR